jgi:hypothetical protein
VRRFSFKQGCQRVKLASNIIERRASRVVFFKKYKDAAKKYLIYIVLIFIAVWCIAGPLCVRAKIAIGLTPRFLNDGLQTENKIQGYLGSNHKRKYMHRAAINRNNLEPSF